MKLESPFNFEETIAGIRAALGSHDFTVMALIDHHQAAAEVGLVMPLTTVLIYGNPRGGTPLMLAAPDFALELPLRVLVRQDEDMKVYVVFNPAETLEGKQGLPAGMAARLAPAEAVIRNALSAGRRTED